MPCYYTGTAEGDARLAAQERLTREEQKFTRMLCKTCQVLEENGIEIPKGIKKWWKKHKKQDKKRSK